MTFLKKGNTISDVKEQSSITQGHRQGMNWSVFGCEYDRQGLLTCTEFLDSVREALTKGFRESVEARYARYIRMTPEEIKSLHDVGTRLTFVTSNALWKWSKLGGSTIIASTIADSMVEELQSQVHKFPPTTKSFTVQMGIRGLRDSDTQEKRSEVGDYLVPVWRLISVGEDGERMGLLNCVEPGFDLKAEKDSYECDVTLERGPKKRYTVLDLAAAV